MLVACAGSTEDRGEGTGSQDLVAGTFAVGHDEVVTIDEIDLYRTPRPHCTGTLIAPRVVLAAGHCVSHVAPSSTEIAGRWSIVVRPNEKVVTPDFFGRPVVAWGRRVGASRAIAFRSSPNNGSDVGLFFLDEPVELDVWPVLATTAPVAGTTVRSFGRMRPSDLDPRFVFMSDALTLRSPAEIKPDISSYCRSTENAAMTQASGGGAISEGDSGGPVELDNSSPPVVLAVNSASIRASGGAVADCAARTDVVAAWIAEQLTAHGGMAAPPKTVPGP
jgi:hypothetical protein